MTTIFPFTSQPHPTRPAAITSWLKKSDVRELDMSVDQALKYVISLGMVMPDDLPVKVLPAQKPSEDGDTEHNN